MRRSVLFAAFAFCGGLHAQQVNNVTFSPSNPTSCQLVTPTCIGSLPLSGQLDNHIPTITGNSVDIVLNASGGSGGNAGFSQALSPLGPFSPGVVSVTLSLTYNGGTVDTWTGQFTVTQGLLTPDPGEFATQDVCNSAPSFPLFSVLGGTPDAGGVWYDPMGELIPNGQFVPGTSGAGFYLYVFDQLEPCGDAEQQVLINYTENNDPGTNATVQLCASGPPVDLFQHVGGTPDPGGAWTRPNGTPLPDGLFVPGVDPQGGYRYTVPGINGCDPAHSTLTVQLAQPPNAGIGGTVQLCHDDDSAVLNNYVTGNEQTTGTWYSPSGFIAGLYNAPINVQGSGAGTYLYVVPGSVCPADTAYLVVELVGPPCTIGIAEISGDVDRFEVVPNPADELVTVSIELGRATSGHTLELLDLDGRVVVTRSLSFNGTRATATVDVSALRAGAYVVRFTSADGRAVRRLMVL